MVFGRFVGDVFGQFVARSGLVHGLQCELVLQLTRWIGLSGQVLFYTFSFD